MEIKLDLTKEKCDVFQEYLHASIRKLTGHIFGSAGSARYRSDGCYEVTMFIDLPVESAAIPLKLVMAIEPDGSLRKVDIFPNADNVEISNWNEHAFSFITGVLSSALAENLSRFFCRSTFCRTGSDLDGEYWLPGFRFAPAMPENDMSYLMNAERYLYIDQEVDAIDQMHASDIASERALQYSARLSLILDVGLYKPPSGMRWFIENKEGEGLISRLGQLGFKNSPWPEVMPQKGADCRLGRYDTSVFSEHQNPTVPLLMCPKETRTILRGLNNSQPDIREAFDSCARLYQISLTAGRGFPTIRLAYQVGAVESITKNISGYKGFSDFIRKEFPLDNRADEFLDYLYGTIRSAHFHSGTFPLGEFNSQKFGWGIGNKESHQNFNIDRDASKLIRQSIMNWVRREIMPRGETKKYRFHQRINCNELKDPPHTMLVANEIRRY